MLNDDFITLTIAKQKNIALIAHDSKKAEMIDWCRENREILSHHFLCGTGTTARMVTCRSRATTAARSAVTSRSAQRLWRGASTSSFSSPTR